MYFPPGWNTNLPRAVRVEEGKNRQPTSPTRKVGVAVKKLSLTARIMSHATHPTFLKDTLSHRLDKQKRNEPNTQPGERNAAQNEHEAQSRRGACRPGYE